MSNFKTVRCDALLAICMNLSPMNWAMSNWWIVSQVRVRLASECLLHCGHTLTPHRLHTAVLLFLYIMHTEWTDWLYELQICVESIFWLPLQALCMLTCSVLKLWNYLVLVLAIKMFKMFHLSASFINNESWLCNTTSNASNTTSFATGSSTIYGLSAKFTTFVLNINMFSQHLFIHWNKAHIIK